MTTTTALINNTLNDPQGCHKKSAYLCGESKALLKIFGSLFIWIIVFMSVFGNLLVMISVLAVPRLRNNVTNLFVFSLALADFLVGFCVMPFYTLSYIYCGCWHYGYTLCRIFMANDVLFCTSSIIHLLCISVDRYVAVVYPLQYGGKVTKKRVLFLIAFSWIYSLSVSHIPVHSNTYISQDSNEKFEKDPYYCEFDVNLYFCIISSVMSFYVPCICMSFMYYRIFCVAKQHEKQMKLNIRNKEDDAITISKRRKEDNNGITIKRGKPSGLNRKLRRESKAAKTLGIIMGCFILCWLPFFLMYTSLYVLSAQVPPDVIDFLFIVGYFNSSLNPFIYAFFNRQFRMAFKSLLSFNLIVNYLSSVTTTIVSHSSPYIHESQHSAAYYGECVSPVDNKSRRSYTSKSDSSHSSKSVSLDILNNDDAAVDYVNPNQAKSSQCGIIKHGISRKTSTYD